MNKHHILKQYFGHTDFRQGQTPLIDAILSGRDVFGIMPTGAGKSICYQLPGLMLEGITLVVSPLISLMKDQVNALTQSGAKAAYINSSLSAGQYSQALSRAAKGDYKIIYVAPERLTTESFLQFARQAKIAMVTIDEAHCVSQWGQDFRPSYLQVVEFIRQLPQRPIISAFTATATAEVREDVISILCLQDPLVITTSFDRKNLYFEVKKPGQKFSALLDILNQNKDKSGIIYCSTRKTVEEVCCEVNQAGFSATRYHAGLSDEERRINQDDFLYDRKEIMVATNAFGMGIDKSNVSFVVHYNMPKNLESYYQEAGRAGRDGNPACCILLYSGKDVRTNQFLIENSTEANKELTKKMRQVVREKERERLKAMTFYCATTDCLREYILRYFGESAPNFCGNCSNCNTNFETVDVTIEAKKIVSCVARIAQKNKSFGKTMVVNILHGSKNEKIKQWGLNSLSTYGIMTDIPVRKIRTILDFLLQKDYLMLSEGEYPVVRLGENWEEIIRGNKNVEMKLPKETKPDKHPQSQPLYDVNQDLFDALKGLRSRLASKAHVPAYIIFSDAALKDMCRKLPRTNEEFLNVSGVGQTKMERYGKLFTELINSYISQKSANPLPK